MVSSVLSEKSLEILRAYGEAEAASGGDYRGTGDGPDA
jgi:hypothetical protein